MHFFNPVPMMALVDDGYSLLCRIQLKHLQA
jgi:hypothetical protein